MIKIKIASIGKTKEKWLNTGIEEYTKRLKPSATIDYIWLKEDGQLVQFASKEPLCICLDVNGAAMDSEAFSAHIQEKIVEGGARLAFVIGGAEGLPESLRCHPNRISLSPLTMTHQLVRLVLLEQLYRAFEIAKGTPYHK